MLKIKELRSNYTQWYGSFGTGSGKKNARRSTYQIKRIQYEETLLHWNKAFLSSQIFNFDIEGKDADGHGGKKIYKKNN